MSKPGCCWARWGTPGHGTAVGFLGGLLGEWHIDFDTELLRGVIGLLGPVCLFGAYHPSADKRGYAWPHETRLLTKGTPGNVYEPKPAVPE